MDFRESGGALDREQRRDRADHPADIGALRMKRAERQPVGDLTLYAGIFCKVWTVPDADTVVPQHAHAHPHLTLLIAGTARVWCNNEYLGELTAPAVVKIP